jgi:hypothetical protein
VNPRSFLPLLFWSVCLLPAAAQDVARAPQFVYPRPNSIHVPLASSIIIRPGPTLDPRSVSATIFTVRGSVSGLHAGRTVLGDDGRTVVFTPAQPFSPGERVSVALDGSLRTRNGETISAYSEGFTAGVPASDAADAIRRVRELSTGAASRASLPVIKERSSLENLSAVPADFPTVTVINDDAPSAGDLFLDNFPFDQNIKYTPFIFTLDGAGKPRFVRTMPTRCLGFTMQPNGKMSYYFEKDGCFNLLDSTYTVVDTFRCGNGFATDLHEFQILPNGHVLMLSYDPERVDMSSVIQGGDSTATVMGIILQELDTSKTVVFQWSSWDHYEVTDATHEDLAAGLIDYAHSNSVELDNDGNLLLSSRHMDEITKIDHSTGDIIWRLGGKHNQFTFVNDSIGFSHQHDIRRIANGDITLFDNGNFHTPSFSRAVEYKLDEVAKTATLVWQFRHTPDLPSSAMGSVQRLANGNTVIGWGAVTPSATEVTPDGKTVFEVSLPDGIFSYRALRFEAPAPAAVPLSADASLRGTEIGQVVPNPAAGSASLQLRIAAPTHLRVSLVDVTGAVVAHVLDRDVEAGDRSVPLDLSRLSAGTYLCRVATSTSVSARPVVVTH